MEDQILSKYELSDEVLVKSDVKKLAIAIAIYAVILTTGTTVCIWLVDFRDKGSFSTIRGENITQKNS